MGGISIYEILLILGVFGSIYLIVKLLRKLSFVERWLAKITLNHYTRFSRQNIDEVHRPDDTNWVPLPFGLCAIFAAPLLFVLIFVVFRAEAGITEFVINVISIIVAIGSIAAALYIHITGRGSRRTKYNLLMLGVSMPAVVATEILARLSFILAGITGNGIRMFSSLAAVGGLTFTVLAIGLILYAWKNRALSRRDAMPTKGMRRLHRMTVKLGFPLAILAISSYGMILLLLYLPIRYTAGEWMRLKPILYLRSFSFPEGPNVFGRVIARVAGQYGVVRCLVHQLQTPTMLQAETRLTERPILSSVDDSRWRDWVQNELRRCAVAIVDTSGNTAGVLWEVEEARKVLGDSEVIEMSEQSSASGETPGESVLLHYALDKKSVRETRVELERRLVAILLG